MIAAANIGPMDVFFVFIMLTSLEPLMKQHWIEASRRFPTRGVPAGKACCRTED